MQNAREDERVAALDQLEILDTGPEPLFDSLTELAALTFDAPIALISLVDPTRQWFKACVGLDVDHTDREISFCQHAILSEEVFIVLNALDDPRFAENPLVTGPPDIRFYAGAPLITPKGHALGTLCVIDTAPRTQFGPVQQARLKSMADTVVQGLIMRFEAIESARTSRVAEEREAQLRQAEQMAGVGTWSLDVATNHTVWSEQVYRIHGIDASGPSPDLEEALSVYHADDLPVFTGLVQRAIEFGESFSAHARLIRPDGEVRNVVVRGEARRNGEGAVAGLFGTFQDVTGLKLADAKLRDSEARLRHFLDHSSDMIVRSDATSQILEASPACRRYGYEAADMVGKTTISFVHPDDAANASAAIRDNMSGQVPDRRLIREFRIRTKDGGHRWVQGNPTVLRNEDGTPREVVSVFRDITEERLAKQALADSEARHRLLTENARDIIACYDPRGAFTYVSPAVETVLGYKPEELIGAKPAAFIHPDDLKPSLKTLAACVAAGPGAEPTRFEYRAFCKDGRTIWLEANPRAIFDQETGAFLEFQDVVRDATERKTLEAETKAARDAAVEATAIKSEFLANMSHEIRTPLTAIIGFSGLLSKRTDLAEAAVIQVKRINGASESLLAIVNDVLDFSKLEAGQMTIAPRPVDVVELAQDAIAMFAPQAEAKSIWLEFNAGPAPPETVILDPDRLRQILLNLIGNAIKFTESGVVRLGMAYDTRNDVLAFEVEDTGAGMDRAQCARLFQRFSQVDASSTRRHGGTGLGLAICKALAEAMGGGVGVTSRPGEGSTFYFHVSAPRGGPVAKLAEIAQREPLSGVRVLLADDNASNRELARALLESFGAEVSEAADGAKAVEMSGERPFDAILLDLHMPTMDGATAMSLIRSKDGPNQDVPMLAFTADLSEASVGEIELFDGVVAKPIVAADMVATLVEATRWNGADGRGGGRYAVPA